MIGITAFIGSALLFGGLILAGIAGWVIEVICARQESREIKAEMQRKTRDERRAGREADPKRYTEKPARTANGRGCQRSVRIVLPRLRMTT